MKKEADSLSDVGRYDEALALYDLALVASVQDTELGVRITFNKALALQALGRHEPAAEILDVVLRRARNLSLLDLEGRALLAGIGVPTDLDASGRVEALVDVSRAVEIARLEEDKRLEAWGQVVRGQVLLELGASVAALEPLKVAEELAFELGNVAAAVDAASLRGFALGHLGDTDGAQDIFGKARRLSLEFGLLDRVQLIDEVAARIPDREWLSKSQCLSIPEILWPTLEVSADDELLFEDAKDILVNAQALVDDIEKLYPLSILSEHSWLAYQQGDFATALTCAKEQLNVACEQENDQQIASALSIVISQLIATGDFKGAGPYNFDLQSLAPNLGPPWSNIASQIQAVLDMHDDRYQDAREGFLASLSGLVHPQDVYLKEFALVSFGIVDVLEGKYSSAVDHFREARRLASHPVPVETCPTPKILDEMAYMDLARFSESEGLLAMALSSTGQHEKALVHAHCTADLAKRLPIFASQLLPLEGLARAHLLAGISLSGEDAKYHLHRAALLSQVVAEQYLHTRRQLTVVERLRSLDIHSIVDEAWQRALVEQGKTLEAFDVAEATRAPDLLGGERHLSPLAMARELAQREEVTLIAYSLIHDPIQALLPARFRGKQKELEELLYIWVVSPDGEIKHRSVNVREAVGTGGVSYALENGQGADRSKLYDILLRPIEGLLPPSTGGERVSRLVFVPQGIIHRAPFASLRDHEGRYLVERFEVVVAPSVAAFNAFSNRPPSSRSAALVVGDPTMGQAEQQDLAEARAEAHGVASRLGTRALIGNEATPKALAEALPQVRLFHYAGHAEADRLDLARSSEAEASLEIEDILDLDLDLDLAVLSACKTGDGDVSSGGILGLTWAFLASGARAVLANHQPADDTVQRQFMERFYAHWTHRDAVSAFRAAFLDLLLQGVDPQNLVGLTLVGVDNAPPQVPLTSN